MGTILHVDSDPSVGLLLGDTLSRAGHRHLRAATVIEALQVLSREDVDLVVSDCSMPELMGLTLLSLLRREGRDVPVIMLTGYSTIEHRIAAIKDGAIDYITKPAMPDQVQLAVERALEIVRLRRENESLRRELTTVGNERQSISDMSGHAVVLTSLNIDQAERVLIRRALEVAKHNRTGTAELLGISVRTLRNKLNGPGRVEVA